MRSGLRYAVRQLLKSPGFSLVAILGIALTVLSKSANSITPSTTPEEATRTRVAEAYSRMPLSFEKNVGQTDPRVEFVSRGPGYSLFLARGGDSVLVLTGSSPAGVPARGAAGPAVKADRSAARAAIRLRLVGARKQARARGVHELPGKVNYLRGQDSKGWRSDIATYARVAYDEIYPGIDMVYYGHQRQLEYDFVAHPGADPGLIALDVDGADRLEIDGAGDLVMHVGGRQVRQRKPVVYQDVGGVRREVDGRYELSGPRRVRIELGTYDQSLPLVIDPVLVYSTYLGGAFDAGGEDFASGIALDAAGNAYVTGYTESADFPTAPGAYDTSANGHFDVFVTKLDPTGGTLAYSTFLGGSGFDTSAGIAVDAIGAAYITGLTSSTDFPATPAAYDTTPNGGEDAFVTKLDPTGATLAYSTFLGGAAFDAGAGIALDAAGRAHVTGNTRSGDFPTTAGAFDLSLGGSDDAFVTKLDATGAALVYSTFLGGSGFNEGGRGIAVDAMGAAYVTGSFGEFTDFPATPAAYDTSPNGGNDVFVTKLDPIGATLVYSTFLGGIGFDSGRAIAVDTSGNAYVTGSTASGDFPTTAGAYDRMLNGSIDDVFVTKLDPAGAALVYSTFVGGDNVDYGAGVAIDAAGAAYITGYTVSTNYPTTAGALDTSLNGESDVFVTKLAPTGAALTYSTLLGGDGPDVGVGIAVDASGAASVAGHTSSTNFPATPGSFDSSANGRDGFAASLNATGSAPLIYATYLGGGLQPGGNDAGISLALDGTGSVYVTGYAGSLDFPTTFGAFDTNRNGGDADAFVTKLNATGDALVYSTFLGGNGGDYGLGITVDVTGAAFVTGFTLSSDFPTTAGAYDTSWNATVAEDAFVAKLGPGGGALAYSTFLGGDSSERGQSIAVDASGAACITGYTFSSNFPTTAGAYDTSANGSYDAFVTKLDATGGTLAYSTFLGRGRADVGLDVAMDAAGAAYVTGFTYSPFFPTTIGAFDTSWNGGFDSLLADAFVTKVDPTGAALAYSTFLGGIGPDYGFDVAVDAAGAVYVTGSTRSGDFPTTGGAYDTSFNGEYDAFVTKLDPAGGALAYSTFVGGSMNDYGLGIEVDATGAAWVAGYTSSVDYPTTPGAHDTSWNGGDDVLVTKLDPTGGVLVYSTFVGGSSHDNALGIAVDAAGAAYVTGYTSSSDFPTTAGAYDTSYSAGADVFITKIGDIGPSRR